MSGRNKNIKDLMLPAQNIKKRNYETTGFLINTLKMAGGAGGDDDELILLILLDNCDFICPVLDPLCCRALVLSWSHPFRVDKLYSF